MSMRAYRVDPYRTDGWLVSLMAGCCLPNKTKQFTGTPAAFTMALGFLAVGWSRSYLALLGASALLGLGNGMSSGLVRSLATATSRQWHPPTHTPGRAS